MDLTMPHGCYAATMKWHW